MDLQSQSKVLQVLQFSTADFVDEVVDALSTSLQAQLYCLERKLDSAKSSEKQWHELASLLESTMDKNLDRWEAFVTNNVFLVPQEQEEDSSTESKETINQHLDSFEILDCLKRRRAEIVAARNIKSKLKQLIKSRELQQQAQREHIAQYAEALGKFDTIQANYVSRGAAVQGTIELNEKITEYDERICALHEVYYLESEQRRLAKKSTVKMDSTTLTSYDTDMDMENKGDLNLLSKY
ncbi:hypothetical protein MIR68_011698 [Amoeboaphelidium protococcarum]|nr:hypothetical protein MIR68_011698 [Amoeboaphelidium protococcarum]